MVPILQRACGNQPVPGAACTNHEEKMSQRVLRSTAIKGFLGELTHPDLAALYNPNMEVQVNVAQDGGTRVDGEFKGKKWHAWQDPNTGEVWKSFRIPLNANTDPESNDDPINFDLTKHAEGIGMTGWDWANRVSRWVAYDFDAITGHSERHQGVLVDHELLAVEENARKIPWVTVRRSTSGKGIHLYVFLDAVETANHNEHAALGRAVLGMMSALVGFDFQGKVDICGGNMWVWHRKMPGTPGLTLLKQGEVLGEVPPNWRDHVQVIQGRRRKNLPQFIEGGHHNESERLFEELTGQRTNVPIDDEHKRLITYLTDHGCLWWWDPDHHMLVTHTIHLKEAHESLRFRGIFRTKATGSERGLDHNCFLFPLRRGSWVVRRYTPGVSEDNTWDQDGAGYTRCFYNRDPDLDLAARAYGAIEHKGGGFVFTEGEQAAKAAEMLGATIDLPPRLRVRPAKLKEHRDGRLIVEVEREKNDHGGDMRGWLSDTKTWHRIFGVQVSTPAGQEIGNHDDLVRHLITVDRMDAGWMIKADGYWSEEPMTHVRVALQSFGFNQKDCADLLGSSIFKPWKIVNFPFQPEYPGDRTWNRDAAQFRFYPSPNLDALHYPHWTRVLEHIGSGLDEAIQQSPWAQANGVATGADYLKCWIASLFQKPDEPLPYLFLYSKEQNTGKSIFHEALCLLLTKGWSRADNALINQQGFNAELETAILCIVEETDLRKQRTAYNRIKDWVTSRQLPVHRKGETPYMIKNTTHWVQTANNAEYCPIFPGDTRITMIQVPILDPRVLIPKTELLALLEKEAGDFLAAVLSLEIPPSGDRLAVPVIATEEKRMAEEANLTHLELFIKESVYAVDGESITIGEFWDKFTQWLDPQHVSEWTKNKVSREMPQHFPKGRQSFSSSWAYGNMAWHPRQPGEPIKDRLVVRNDILTSITKAIKAS
jgi:hypothetical protein